MRFWPLSVLAASPLLPEAYMYEIQQFNRRLPSQGAYLACVDVARRTPSIDAPNTVIIETVGAPDRRVFADYPTEDEWLRLERVNMMESADGTLMFMFMDALH